MSGPEYYDKVFSRSKGYLCPPEDSPYYILWAGILDLIKGHVKILDVGCGPGQFAILCARAGHEYTGLDWSSVAVEAGKKGLGEFHLVDVQEDVVARRAHFEGDHEVFTFIEFLEHVPRDLEILADVPQGRIIILTVPDFPSNSHFRFFKDMKQAKQRYRDLIKIDTGMTCLSTNLGQPAKIFLLKGIRR